MDDNLYRNLLSLKAEFHDKGKALRGYNNIEAYINSNKNRELAYLLRDHKQESVYGNELVQRFEIDTLIEFYNILFIAALAGYVPPKLSDELNSEIIKVLSNPSVKPYYEDYYPYKLVEYTHKYASTNIEIDQKPLKANLSAFNDFLSMNRMLKKDDDIERFTGMLDFVWYDNVTIKDVIETLSSYSDLNKAITNKNKDELAKGVWGFFKYTTFISQFRELLETINDNHLLQSAMWLFHGYYFDRMNQRMKDVFSTAFSNIEKALSSPMIFENIAIELYGEHIPEDFDEAELRQYSKYVVQQSKDDVVFVLNPDWKKPLQAIFEHKM